MPLPKLLVTVPQDGYSFQDGDSVLRAKLSSGPSRTRLDMIGAPLEASIALVLEPSEYVYWRAFYRSSIALGSLPFLIDILIEESTVEERQVKMIGAPQTSVKGTAHIVQFSVEVVAKMDDASTDESIVLIYELYGSEGSDVLDALEKLVNVDLEIG